MKHSSIWLSALALPCLLLSWLTPACAIAQDTAHPATHAPHAAQHAVRALPISVPLDAAARAHLPRERVVAKAHGQALDCEGVSLLALLRASKAMPDAPLRGAALTQLLQVSARDGYRAVFSLAELDPTLGNRRVVLVERCAGKPLADDDGPLRLIVPDDSRPARWVRQVEAITVMASP